MKILDWYIIRKFIGTYIYAIILIVGIAVIFDFSEKIDDFMEKGAPFNEIIFRYYLNFIPYFANLFSSLFVSQVSSTEMGDSELRSNLSASRSSP